MNCLPIESNSLHFRIHALIEDVFKFTADKDHVTGTKLQPLVYLEKAAGVCKKPWMDVDALEHALFERLLLEDCTRHIINANKNVDLRVTIMNECITYLFECYKDLILYQNKAKNENDEDWARAIDHIIKLIVRNAATAIKQPEFQDIHSQVINVFSKNNITHHDKLVQFFQLVAAEIREGNDSFYSVCKSIEPIIYILRKQIQTRGSIRDLQNVSLDTLEAFAKIPEFALTVVETSFLPSYDKPEDERYTMSILGTLFSMPSQLLADNSLALEENWVENSIHGDLEFMGQQFWPSLEILSMRLHRILLSFLEASSQVHDDSLGWIRKFIKYDSEYLIMRTEKEFLWYGFQLNLCSVLLRFCGPIIRSTNLPELLTINPTYVFLEDMPDLWKDEILDFVPHKEGYSSYTEWFFLAHCALRMGLDGCLCTLNNLQRKINQKRRILKNYPEVFGNVDELPTRMYYSLGTVFFEPSFIDNLADFLRATCTWLVQLLFDDQKQSHGQNPFAPPKSKNLNIELPDPPDTSKCVPEFLFENLYFYLMLLSRHHPITLEKLDFDFLNPVLTTLIIYMGSNRVLHEPYESVHWILANCMLCLLHTPARMDSPKMDMECGHMNFSDRTYKLLNTHPYRHKIIPLLLEAFFGVHTNCCNDFIITHEFPLDMIFDYYHRMYAIMDHLWTLEDQKQVFKQLAVEAEQNLEAVNPPLFLRFIEMLMNDASYLLQKAVCSMENIQLFRANLEEELNDKTELLMDLDYAEQTAISTNILCMDAITMLEYLTEEIETIFCHNSVVSKLAGVLNNFLLHLVSPKENNFAIENMDEYKFDPATILGRICAVYVNLGCNDIFHMAVSHDECAPQLLHQAADIMMQSKSVKFGNDLDKLRRHVGELAKQIEGKLGMLSETPEDFLDKITSTLMFDPVILPSSRLVVDRLTAEKWLSENQTDPYNRSPLTIDMVQPDVKLKQKIKEWIEKK